MSVFNLLSSLPRTVDKEFIEELIVGRGIRIERIVSFGQASPDGYWYDQEEAELVVVLSGNARLTIEGENEDRVLGPGDATYLPAHCRHRVISTDAGSPTVWLAIFFDSKLDPIPTEHLSVEARRR